MIPKLLMKAGESGRPLLMGILNVTPDSFYDGGRYFNRKRAVERAVEMADEGADLIDVGGESSRPGAGKLTEKEELKRVIPVIEAVASQVTVPISIDTYKANVAEHAMKAGAVIVNDISALRFDSRMVDVIVESGSPVVLMHMLGNPKTMQISPCYDNVVDDIIAFFKKRIIFAVEHGIQKENIIVDPGIGFGKTLEHNLAILKEVDRFHETGCTVMIGASRKSMIGKIAGAPAEERLWGTAAITAYCVMKGIEIHRVHDVKAMRQVCDVTAAIRNN